jgi:hypothetical protein
MERYMRYICAQPANDYYTWQVEVVIQNFKRQGINPNHIDILCAIDNGVVPEVWRKLQAHYNTIRFFFYNDTREDKSYTPAIYFNLLKNHMMANPELKEERLFLHDSDIIFTRPPELGFIKKKIWYMSDTNSYINYDYIQQKEPDIYQRMCDIIGIDPLIPKLMNSNSGGAQYIIIGEGWDFWDKVEKDSVELYAFFCMKEPSYIKKYEGDYPIQKWTAGMWALLWNAWKSGHETVVDKNLGFGWSTQGIDVIDKNWILHNAGVTDSNSGLFFKGKYINTLPYKEILDIDDKKASSYYWKEVQETGKNTILNNA